MNFSQVLNYLLIWGLKGAFLFNFIVLYLFRSRMVYESRGEDGLRKKDSSPKGWISTVVFLMVVILFLLTGNYFSLRNFELNFWNIFWLNFGLMIILTLYDSLVIDWLVIAIWRPAFLRLPDDMNRESMKKHLLITIPVAPVICLAISAMSTGASWLLWMR